MNAGHARNGLPARLARRLAPLALSLALAWLATQPAQAVEFRTFNAIPTPGTAAGVADRLIGELCGDGDLCTDLVAVADVDPVSRRKVQNALRELARGWNSSRLDELLAREFADRNRLLDTISDVVPRDARLRVLALRNVRTLAQYRQPATPEQAGLRLSIVLARAETQVEYNDPVRGFVRSEKDVQDYVLVIAEQDGSAP